MGMSLHRAELYQLVDFLPENEINVAKRFLEFLISNEKDPVLQVLKNAPLDDEPLTESDIVAIKEAEKDIAEGKTQSLEDVMREFGL